MISNNLALSLLLATSLPTALVGCQSTFSKNNPLNTNSVSTLPVIISQKIGQAEKPEKEQEIVVMDTEVTDETPPKTKTLQWASNYHWQLTQIRNQQNSLININNDVPITLEVAPSSLSLSQGCQHFAINFVWMSAPPFEYGSELIKRPSFCKNDLDNKISKSTIDELFPKNSILKLGVELLPLARNEIVNTQIASKNLIVKIENGNTLVFDGMPKAFKEPTGLPIDKALLERYDWRLASAVRNNFDNNGQNISRQSIGDFYHPEFPVSLRFVGSTDGQYAFFNSNCNGVGGPYILTKDHTLFVGSGPQTLMGCGITGNKIERELSKLMSNSESTLSLSLQPSQPTSLNTENKTDILRYNLLQTMASGETLVWQNEEKKIP